MNTPDQPEIRVGDTEREAAVSALGDHYAAGRLTKEEFDERSERAYAARTRSALMPLFADLPRPQAARATPPSVQPSPGLCSGAGRGYSGRASGAWLVPVVVVLVALFVFSHIMPIVLLVVGFVLLARMGRHWDHRSRAGSGRYARR